MTKEEYGFKVAEYWSKGLVSDKMVIDAYQDAGESKEWWHGWMEGLRKFYFEPFEFEKGDRR